MDEERANVMSGLSYDAVAILGFGDAAAEPLPQEKEGEIVLRYGGWSQRELRHSDGGHELMHPQDWYHMYPWSSAKLPSGTYHLRVPVPESKRKTFAEQERMLPEGEWIAPVVLVASALLVHRLQTGEDLLKNDFTRCREQATAGNRVVLGWGGGRLSVYSGWAGRRPGGLWASSVRTS